MSVETKLVRPTQLAWLHRIELDRNGIQVWEKPNGNLYLHRGTEPLMIPLEKVDKTPEV
jgi:hypothetical protein